MTFDSTNKIITLDTELVSANEVYSRWVDWSIQGDNLKHGQVVRQIGGDDLGGGISIPPYYFLQNGWKIRPKEADHNLEITGNLFTSDNSNVLVNTLGNYNVMVQFTVPVQAQAFGETIQEASSDGDGASISGWVIGTGDSYPIIDVGSYNINLEESAVVYSGANITSVSFSKVGYFSYEISGNDLIITATGASEPDVISVFFHQGGDIKRAYLYSSVTDGMII